MKNLKTRFLLLVTMMVVSVATYAYDVKIDGIYFNLDSEAKTAEVTSGGSKYTNSVTIPSTITYEGVVYNVTSIGEYAFRNCSSLTSVNIPGSVTNIGYCAFYECIDLTSVTIPNSVTSIGYGAFSDCSALSSVTISLVDDSDFVNYLSRTDIRDIFHSNSLDGIIYNIAINGDVQSSITIPNSVKSIGDDAFNGCSGLTSVTIPSSVTNIGSSAFCNCTGLTSVTIPNSVTSIGYGAFSYCSGFTSIIVESGNPKYDSRDDCNAIIETSSNTLIIGCKNTSIPNSVTSIGNYAFAGCKNLTSMSIPSSVTSIGYDAFRLCTSLTSVTIPNSVTSIGGYAFYSCIGLTSITIPNSVTSIREYTFSSCIGLTSVTIPSSVTSIGEWAFMGCAGLNTVTIPNSVTSVGKYAFWGCNGLTSVSIGNSVSSIGYEAFSGCKGLTSVTCLAETVPETDPFAFYGVTLSNVTLIAPEKSIAAYKGKAPWKNFKDFVSVESTFEKCATPTIAIVKGKITAKSETEYSVCHIDYSLAASSGSGTNATTPTIKLTVTAYATAEGFAQSETAEATFDLMELLSNTGDVNGDGNIDVKDVTDLVNKVLKK